MKQQCSTALSSLMLTLALVWAGGCTLEKGYQNLGGRFSWDRAAEEECAVRVFSHRKSGAPLQGKYRLDWGGGLVDYAQFHEGRWHGVRSRYERRKLKTRAEYRAGRKHGHSLEITRYAGADGKRKEMASASAEFVHGRCEGLQETVYSDLTVTEHYQDGLKTGQEVGVSGSGTDTIYHLRYTLDQSFAEPDDAPPFPTGGFTFSFYGKLTVEYAGGDFLQDFEYLADLVQLDGECREGISLVVESFGQRWMFYGPPGATAYWVEWEE